MGAGPEASSGPALERFYGRRRRDALHRGTVAGRRGVRLSVAENFHFNLGDPRSIMTFIGFDSRTRRWSEWH